MKNNYFRSKGINLLYPLPFFLLLASLTISCFIKSASAQTIGNIKESITILEKNGYEKLPFFRKKTENYRPQTKGRMTGDGSIAQTDIRGVGLYKHTNYNGVPFLGYIDFNCSIRKKATNGEILNPNLFKSTKIFNSQYSKYIFIPFLISAGGDYYEDIFVVCDRESGDIKDALLASQVGYEKFVNNISYDIQIRQWSLNEKGEVTVYELKIISDKIVYFATAPSVLRMQRVDTTYKIDENGKFYQVSKKEYKPKDYNKTELYTIGKEIWEGNETPIA